MSAPSSGLGDMLYAWQVKEDDGWGIIAAMVPGLTGLAPLVSRSLGVARKTEPLAVSHAQETGLPVRLARFVFTEVIEGVT